MQPNFKKLTDTELTVPEDAANKRLDRWLAEVWPDYSRTFVAKLIKDGHVHIEELSASKVKPSLKLEAGWSVIVEKPAMDAPDLPPEDIPLDVIYEDEAIIVINKPAALPVHPPRAGRGGTLANALAFRYQNLSQADTIRPGIVHRLDADTSGVIVCAKDESAHFKLAKQFEDRTTQKTYLAIVRGRMKVESGTIDNPIGRHPDHYEMMRIDKDGKQATTHWEMLEKYKRFAYLKLTPKSGRTHQLRVHLSSINHPIVSDRIYSKRPVLMQSEITGEKPEAGEQPLLARQALHAASLSFVHPRTGEQVTFEAPLPEDFSRALEALRAGPKAPEIKFKDPSEA
ncbi:RluA family pseudouridine synthase [Planctomycetota bacterium]|nr:RluA family pseudouridine synthase [Planctomycetota bacterium]